MSCQQVPRLPEDPYTFTEPPVTAKYFSSQSQRVHPYHKSFARSSPSTAPAAPSSAFSATQSQPFALQTAQRPELCPQQPAAAAATVHPRSKNGQTPPGGRLPKRNGPIYGKTINRQQQQQQQNHPPPHHHLPHHSPLQAASPPATISFLPPAQQKPQFYTSATVTPSHLAASSVFHPPTCITTTTTTGSGAVASEKMLKSANAYPQNLQQQQQQHSTFGDRRRHVSPKVAVPSLCTPSVATAFAYTTKNTKKHFRPNDDHEFPSKTQQHSKLFGHHSLGKSLPSPSPLYRKNSISSTCSSSASSSPPSASSFSCSSSAHHLGSSLLPSSAAAANAEALFTHPIKVEVKLEETRSPRHDDSSLKDEELQPLPTSVVARSKRSYSESSHHEALQRISAKKIKVETDETKPDPKSSLPESTNVVVSLIPQNDRRPSGGGGGSTETPSVQQCWFMNEARFASRDQRLEHKLAQLRRQSLQHATAQKFRSIAMARRRMQVIRQAMVRSAAGRLDDKPTPSRCQAPSCSANAMPEAVFCYAHITKGDKQQLFHACTAKFADNSQCRLTVFDIGRHEMALCREHALKRDNYTRMVNELKPKRHVATSGASRSKKAKPAAAAKRNRKKKLSQAAVAAVAQQQQQQQPQPRLSPTTRLYQAPDRSPIATQHFAISSNDSFVSSDVSQMFAPSPPQHQLSSCSTSIQHPFLQNLNNHHHHHHHHYQQSLQSINTNNSHHYFMSHTSVQQQQQPSFYTNHQMSVTSDGGSQHAGSCSQDMYTMCENSSAYESSEDTGIGGGLSDAEQLMGGGAGGVHDDMLEEHELTSVLNQLPPNAFDELFTVEQSVYKSTQDEEEYLDRALEDVDESLQQMAGSDHFLDGFLDVDDEILEDVDISSDHHHHHHQTTTLADITSGAISMSSSSSLSGIGSLMDIRGLVQT